MSGENPRFTSGFVHQEQALSMLTHSTSSPPPTSLFNVVAFSFHVTVMKAASVHHLLPSEQGQPNKSISKNGNYSTTFSCC